MEYYGNSYNSKGYLTRDPDFDPKIALNVIRNDPTVKACVVTLVDKALEGNWGVRGIDKKSRQKALENKLKELRFNQVLRKVLFNLILYNNAFIEIVKKGDEVTDLNVLETTLMRIDALDNGDIKKFYQEIGGNQSNPEWKPDQIIFIKLDDINNNVWSDISIRSLYDTVLLKDYVRQWMGWFFKTNQMRGVYAIETTNDTKVKEFVSYLKQSEKDVTKPMVLMGKVVYQTLNDFAEKGKSIIDLLVWCDQQILQLMQVPPIAVGVPDSSGRSNSVEQNQSLNTRVKSLHRVLEDSFTYDLFPKINFAKNEFTFTVVDNVVMEQALSNIQLMRNAMFTEEAMKEYLDNLGITFTTETVFKDPVEMAEEMKEATSEDSEDSGMSNKSVGTGNEGSIGNKSADSAPSRMRQTNQSVSKANRKQIITNSKFNGYPYNYEVKD